MKFFTRILLIAQLLVGFWIQPLVTQAANPTATVSVSPSSGDQTVGNNFTVSFKLDTGGQPVTVLGVDVNYSSNLQFISFDESGSVFMPITNPDPSGNHFRFERWRTDAGFNGSDGLLIKVTFKPLQSGTGSITIDSQTTQILHADDQSNILKNTINGSYSLINASGNTTSTPTPQASGSQTTATPAGTTPKPKTSATSKPAINSTQSPSPAVGGSPATPQTTPSDIASTRLTTPRPIGHILSSVNQCLATLSGTICRAVQPSWIIWLLLSLLLIISLAASLWSVWQISHHHAK